MDLHKIPKMCFEGERSGKRGLGLLTGQSLPIFVICQTRRDSLPDSPFCSRVVPVHRSCTCSWRTPGQPNRMLDLHLKKGSDREARNCLRIYFLWDAEERLIVVGCLTSHLGTRACRQETKRTYI